MNELPLYDIDIYGSWETFVEFWELMNEPIIIYKQNKYKTPYDIKKYYIDNIIRFIDENGNEEDYEKEILLFNYVTDFNDLPVHHKANNTIDVIEKIYLTGVEITQYDDDNDVLDSISVKYNQLQLKNLQQIFELIKD
jgi:hypothetical protein